MLRVVACWMLASIGSLFVLASGGNLTWQPWVHLPGVFDLAGPRSDGRLVANAGSGLFLVSPGGTVTPFARGPGGYAGPGSAEAYLDVSAGLSVSSAYCSFSRDDVFIIRPGLPIGVTKVGSDGLARNFVDLTGVEGLNGIVFDRVGGFDHRLLVTGSHQGHTVVFAIDCNGKGQVITRSAPALEGGLAVAPITFGGYGGDLIAPDELSGSVWAISPEGVSHLVIDSGIRHGGDVGVESEGFVPAPAGFGAGGWAYVADRGTPGNPHPGTDTILRLPGAQLKTAGLEAGDLLIAAEGGAVTISVRCAATCTVTTIARTETTAHIEGHLVAAPAPLLAANGAHGNSPAVPWALPIVGLVILAGVVAGAGVVFRRLTR